MNVWLSLLAAWLADFALLATVLLAAGAALRLVLRDPGSRVLLAWGTWLSIVSGAVLVAMPMWPKRELSRLIEPRVAPRPIVVAVGRPPPPAPVVLIEPISGGRQFRTIDLAGSGRGGPLE